MGEVEPKVRGRPRDTGKTDAILDAARTLVKEHGFAGASLEAVAARAGVSKVTVYNRFGGRAGLWSALVRRETAWMERGLREVAAGEGPLRERLAVMGERLTAFWARPDVMRFDLQMALAGEEHQDLRAAFHDAGPEPLRAAVATLLEAERGASALGDPERAAEWLIALWRGVLPDAARFGLAPPLGDAERRERAREATALFLRGIGATE